MGRSSRNLLLVAAAGICASALAENPDCNLAPSTLPRFKSALSLSLSLARAHSDPAPVDAYLAVCGGFRLPLPAH